MKLKKGARIGKIKPSRQLERSDCDLRPNDKSLPPVGRLDTSRICSQADSLVTDCEQLGNGEGRAVAT